LEHVVELVGEHRLELVRVEHAPGRSGVAVDQDKRRAAVGVERARYCHPQRRRGWPRRARCNPWKKSSTRAGGRRIDEEDVDAIIGIVRARRRSLVGDRPAHVLLLLGQRDVAD
jgi:hypothetical protein